MRLFGRHKQPGPELAAALEQLDQLAEASPPLRDACRLQAAILRAIYRDPPKVGRLDIAPERAAAKLRAGVPLLRDDGANGAVDLPLDMAAAEELMLRLCRVSSEHGESPDAAAQIGAALGQRALSAETLALEALAGRADAIRERAGRLGLDGNLLCTVLRFSLLPALERLAAQLAPLRAAAPWGRGHCPTCGSWPLLGEYRGLDQTRLLRCGLCATAWTIDRLLCPFCGSREHEDLGYLYVEGDEHKRAATCESCRCYVKMLATLTAIPPIELPIHDLATVHLDMVALERGYTTPR
jgi:FdhE protein